jgi:hypothetical protein
MAESYSGKETCRLEGQTPYHLASVIMWSIVLGLKFLGTHSEKVKGWAYGTDSTAKKNTEQRYVSLDGAKAAFFASRKINRVPSYAILYRNGSKGVGQLHTSLPLNGVWDLVRNTRLSAEEELPTRAYDDAPSQVKQLMSTWESLVIELTRQQARTPWFEMRPGHATGTTFYQWLCVAKFILLNDSSLGEERVQGLFELFGMKTNKKSVDDILRSKTTKQLKAACKTLGYTFTGNSTEDRHQMAEVVSDQVPAEHIVFQRIVRSWCMTPIKRKSKRVSEAFRQGRLAEIEIAGSLGSFLTTKSNQAIISTDLYNTGLLQSKALKVAAVSPDAVGVVTCARPDDSDASVSANDVRKLFSFFENENHLSDIASAASHSSGDESEATDGDGEGNAEPDKLAFTAAFEFKHHSSVLTIAQTERIVSTELNGHPVRVLDLRAAEDRELFRKAVPSVTYRCQVVHEAVVCSVGCTVFAVGTTEINYALLVLVPNNVSELCHDIFRYMTSNHLDFLFKPGTNEYDKELSRFPDYGNKVSWGHANSAETVKCQLQMMMELKVLRNERNGPLPACDGIVPQVVKTWDVGKGPIDDLSKVLAHNLGKFGAISPMLVLWVRWAATMLYCSWRLYSLQQCYAYVYSVLCNTHTKYLHERQRMGGTFEDYLKEIFHDFPIPEDLLPVSGPGITGHTATVGQVRPSKKLQVSRKEWNEKPELINFRVDGNPLLHIPTSMARLVANKNITSHGNTFRRHCKFCTVTHKVAGKTVHASVFPGETVRLTASFCSLCLEALHDTPPTSVGRYAKLTCHDRWHIMRGLPIRAWCLPCSAENEEKES